MTIAKSLLHVTYKLLITGTNITGYSKLDYLGGRTHAIGNVLCELA